MNTGRIYIVITFLLLINITGCSLHLPLLVERDLNAELVFLTPQNHSQVRSPVNLQFQLSGMQQRDLKGKDVSKTYIHVLVNRKVPSLNRVLPNEEAAVIEIEQGKNSVILSLPIGTHKLQLIATDGLHRAHIPPLISEIRTIKVTK